MRARTLLAALHFNENSSRPQAMSKDGHAQWNASYPKYKNGGTIKEIKVKCTYNYIDKLSLPVQKLRSEYPSYDKAKVLMALFHANTLKIINLSKWCLKQQVSKLANLNAIFLLDDSQMLITYYSD